MGFQAMRPFVMRNPPWALWITLPLGVLNYTHAWLFWMASLISCLACSAVILWIASAGDRQRTWVALVLAFLFAPTLACLSVGQTAPIVLLGIALFLWLEAEHEFWAGTVLLAAAFKPQIALLFWIALGLWCFQYRRWKLIAGLVSAWR